MNFVKLLNFELQRFIKFWFALALIMTVMQVSGAIYSAKSYVKYSTETIKHEQLETVDFLMNYGPYTMSNYLNTSFFMFSIMLVATVIGIYIFFIWYRDWLGKSAFMYRLLMLPSSRIHIYTSKLTTIIFILLGLTGYQLVLLTVAQRIIQSIVPAQLYLNESIVYMYSTPILALIYPNTLLEGVLLYGIGVALVTMLFTTILCERSFGIPGVLIGALYVIVGIGALFIPTFFTDALYIEELHMIVIGIAFILILISTLLSHYLLKRKITV